MKGNITRRGRNSWRLKFDRGRDANGKRLITYMTVRGTKRHPTLEDDVIVFANATILGGNTRIGARSKIGSNVWLTHSVDADTTVVLEKPALRLKGATPPDQGWSYQI